MKVVFVADDLGYSSVRDEGIFETARFCARSVSLLVNGITSKDAAARAAREQLDVGLHFNVTEGTPISSPVHIPTLVDREGFFLGKQGFWEACMDSKVNPDHVAIEAEAQLRRFVELNGCTPTFFNGHNHVHVIPSIAECLARVFAEHAVTSTRIPVELFDEEKLSPFLQRVHQFGLLSQGVYRSYKFRVTEAFIGLTVMGNSFSAQNIVALLQRARDWGHSSCEVMTHPGYRCLPDNGGCGQGPDEFSLSSERDGERETLCSPALHAALQQLHISCVRMTDV